MLVLINADSLHLVGGAASSCGEQLVSQTNTEHRLATTQHTLHLRHSLPTHARVPGSVTEEQAVELSRVQHAVPRHHVYASSAPRQAAHLVVLEATVHDTDTWRPCSVVRHGLL